MLCTFLHSTCGTCSVAVVFVANGHDVCRCLDLLEPNLVFLQSTLQSTQDTFATTILQCFLQYALQGCAEPSVDAETEGSSCSVKSIVEVFESRTLDKTCAVRVTALQVMQHSACYIHCLDL